MNRRIDAIGPALLMLLVARPGAAQTSTPTFSKDVAPILYKNCVTCHRPGEIGPMPLLTYVDARPWVRSMRERVAAREMPPWQADPKSATFRNARVLAQQDIDTIVKWATGGAPAGNPADLPPLPDFPEGWQMGKPDVEFEIPVAVDIPESGLPPTKSFTVRTDFKKDVWVVGAEVRVEDRRHVDRVIVNIVPPRPARPPRAPLPAPPILVNARSQAGADQPLTIDEQQRLKAAPKTTGVDQRLVSYVLGAQPFVAPAGFARKIPAGSSLSFTLHYVTNGVDGQDRTKVGLIFAKEAPTAEVALGVVDNAIFELPAGADNVAVESEGVIQQDLKLWTLHPEMRFRGKDITYTAVYPDGRREVLLNVPRFRVRWQLNYEFADPKLLPKGTRLLVTAHYDNSQANRLNPDPQAVVHSGDQDGDEVLAAYFVYTLENQPKAAAR